MSRISPSFIHQLGLDAALLRELKPEIAAMFKAAGEFAQAQGDFFRAAEQKTGQAPEHSRPAPVSPPVFRDSTHPAGSLRAQGDTIRTPGGYRIEMLGQFEWKITGPDGKSTRVWGDPHVEEGDGGKWDFKRNSTFVLGDGTRVNVTAVPYGNGNTVTSQLEVISGNDRVVASGIDKGKGTVGTVTQDGFAHANSFSGDAFVMGRETDDWSFNGREITGSEGGGDNFTLGGELRPLVDTVRAFGGGMQWTRAVLGGLMSSWNDRVRPSDIGFNAYSGNDRARWERPDPYDKAEHVKQVRQEMRAIGRMFVGLSALYALSQQFSAGRNGPLQL